MNFPRVLFLILVLTLQTKAGELDAKYRLIKSALEHFRSRSVLIVAHGEDTKSSNVRLIANTSQISDYYYYMLELQKKLSSVKDFYYCKLTTFSNLAAALKNKRQSLKQTVVILNFVEKYAEFLQNVTNERDVSWFLTATTLEPKHYRTLSLPLDSEFLIAHGNDNEGYNLTEIYDTQSETKLFKRIGWIKNGGFFLNASLDLFVRRCNLEGATIKIVVPMIGATTDDICAQKSFDIGIAVVASCIYEQLWEIMTDKLNATTNFLVIPDLTHDVILQTDAELTFRSAPLTSQDFDTRSFVWPVFNSKVDVVAKYIGQEIGWRTYISPINKEMWIVILIWISLWDVVLSAAEYILHKNGKGTNYLRYYNEYSFTAAYAFCSQGVSNPSKFLSTQILFLMLFIVPAVVFQGYSAILESYLIVHQDKKPFRSLEELSRTKEYKLGWHNSFPLEYMFNLKDMSPLNQALLHNNVLPPDKHPATDIEAVQRMCNENFVFLVFIPTVLALKPRCKYFKLEQYFKIFFTSIEIKKNSPYKFLLDRCERAIDYSGVLPRILDYTVMEYIFDELPFPDSEVQPITMNNIVLPFAILALGIIISVILLVLELARFDLKSNPGKTINNKNC